MHEDICSIVVSLYADPVKVRVKNILFAEIEMFSVNVKRKMPRVTFMATEVDIFNVYVSDSIANIISDERLRVMEIIERVNLINEASRAEMNIRTNAEKELLDV